TNRSTLSSFPRGIRCRVSNTRGGCTRMCRAHNCWLRPSFTVTPSSAGSRAAWMWSTRSGAYPPGPPAPSRATYPRRRSSSHRPHWSISNLPGGSSVPSSIETKGFSMSNPKVELHIAGYGVITLELDQDKASKSAANFLAYVNKGHYDNTVFHRVIFGFMVQGGGFEPGMKQKPIDAPVENEANNGLKNKNYMVAMARIQAPHSATVQFFINVADNEFLNHTAPSAQGWGYVVFGKVVGGTDVVDRIKAVKTGRKGFHDDVPNEDVVIEKAVAVDR